MSTHTPGTNGVIFKNMPSLPGPKTTPIVKVCLFFSEKDRDEKGANAAQVLIGSAQTPPELLSLVEKAMNYPTMTTDEHTCLGYFLGNKQISMAGALQLLGAIRVEPDLWQYKGITL